ncbi:PseudoU_synth_2 domain-containing protein [Cephalotus follicularis]|uniref:PseudoU_synth_2 domain-containing protein n=1 Tax=Cephalotus follicularis TaxID=3775 RepID=A0A1Q3BU58_CEPFO|nr:PseudoU_synth_2 domain-containing protein [Cephalotus follicularis]
MFKQCEGRVSMYWMVTERHMSKICRQPPSAVIRVSNNVARVGSKKEGRKPRQLLYLPPFPGKNSMATSAHVTAITWVKYYLYEIRHSVIHSHFRKGLVSVQVESSNLDASFIDQQGQTKPMREMKPIEVMAAGARVCIPVSIAETRISSRFDTIPSSTLHPNADEIAYLQRLVKFKDSAILVLNKPPKLPVKGNLPVHNSMDGLAAAALSYDYEEGPKLVQRLDKESSGLLVMGRTQKSVAHLHWLFSDSNKEISSCKAWNDACEAMYQRYWALVIGCPKEKEGVIRAPLSKVLLDDGKTERIILAQNSCLEASQEAVTEYRILGPSINGCSWIELQPLTNRKHQLRVHCAEALGTPIVGDYKYGWFVHRKWKQTPQVDIEPTSGKPYKLRRPYSLDIQKGSVLSKVPLLHLHYRELVLPNIAKFLSILDRKEADLHPALSSTPDLLRFVVSMPSHMKISWNLMSSYLV